MDTKKYEVFIRVADEGSFTRAGEQLGITQSGVSHIISALENELGFTLMARSRTGIRLTDDGSKALPIIRRIIDAENELNRLAEDIRGLSSGTVAIGTFTSVAVHWLPRMIKEFQQSHPQVEFRLLNGDYHDVDEWLDKGLIDIGFIALPAPAGCEAVPLIEDRLLAVLPVGHPLAARESCRVSQVAAEPFISLLDASDNDARKALEKAGVKPNIKFRTKDDYAIIAMVGQGLGVSIMPELVLTGRSESVETRPLDPPSSRTIALALPSSHVSPAGRYFARFAADWVKRSAKPVI